MTSSSTNSTFKQGAFANTTGIDTIIQQLTVELLADDPTDLTTTFPRAWYNYTTFTLKITVDGTTVKSVALA